MEVRKMKEMIFLSLGGVIGCLLGRFWEFVWLRNKYPALRKAMREKRKWIRDFGIGFMETVENRDGIY